MRRWVDAVLGLIKLAAIAGLLALGSCTTARTILKQAPTDIPAGWTPPPRQPIPAERAKRLLEDSLYGRMDLGPQTEILSRDTLDAQALGGLATLFQWRLSIGFGAATRQVDLVALIPNGVDDAPIILSQNFCPNQNVVPLAGVRAPESAGFDCGSGGLFGLLMTQIFGRYIVTPPLEDVLSRGYGFAAIYPSQFVPDNAERGHQVLDALFPDDSNRPGALAVWTSLFPVAAKVIEADHGARTMIAYGHSRFGKTALMAGAWSTSIDAVIAHQSGTLGASDPTDRTGEPISALLESYPHWAGPGLADYADRPGALPVRPADLLALTADKPVLLGNARRDVWSDPWGAFSEAKAAWPDRFSTARPGRFQPQDRKAYWLRPGTHGVVKEDWPAFLDFLDAQWAMDRIDSD